MKYRSKAERNADAMIRRANTQLRGAAKAFGLQSKEYADMEKKILHAYQGDFDRYLKKDPATGALQVRRTAENVRIAAYRPDKKHRTAEGKALEQITSNMTVQQKKDRLLSDYESRTGNKPKTKAEKDTAVKEQRDYMDSLGGTFRQELTALYELEKQLGYPLQALDDIRDLSQGGGTDQETLEEMERIASEELASDYHEPASGLSGY